jgi:hypothetical protein
VVLFNGLDFLFEFKVGEYEFSRGAIDQVMDYALDLKYFYKESHNRTIIPMLIATKTKSLINNINFSSDNISNVLLCNETNIRKNIEQVCCSFNDIPIKSEVDKFYIYANTNDYPKEPMNSIVKVAIVFVL